jgi:hypothetical protein
MLAAALAWPLPALAAHGGAIGRNGYSPGDAASFVVAALALWFVRRALRRRQPKPGGRGKD